MDSTKQNSDFYLDKYVIGSNPTDPLTGESICITNGERRDDGNRNGDYYLILRTELENEQLEDNG